MGATSKSIEGTSHNFKATPYNAKIITRVLPASAMWDRKTARFHKYGTPGYVQKRQHPHFQNEFTVMEAAQRLPHLATLAVRSRSPSFQYLVPGRQPLLPSWQVKKRARHQNHSRSMRVLAT